MSNVLKYFIKGIHLQGESSDITDNVEGSLFHNSSQSKLKSYIQGAVREVVLDSQAQTLTNKTINAFDNSITNIRTLNFSSSTLNTSITLAAASDSQVPSALAVKTFVENFNSQSLSANLVSYNNSTSNLTATNVQTAIDEVETRVDGVEQHITSTVAHLAGNIVNLPQGNLSATNVQNALNELQSDIDNRALTSTLSSHTLAATGVHGLTSSVVGTDDSQTLTTKTINADNNTILNLETDNFKASVINTSSNLSGATDTQIPSALAVRSYADSVILNLSSQETSFQIANNTLANVTGLIFNPSTYRSVKIEYSIYRKTDTLGSAKAQVGQLRFVYNTQSQIWLMSDDYAGQDSGVVFSINNTTGQVQYSSSNILGDNYSGVLKYQVIKTFSI
jgi:hypothetical protein